MTLDGTKAGIRPRRALRDDPISLHVSDIVERSVEGFALRAIALLFVAGAKAEAWVRVHTKIG